MLNRRTLRVKAMQYLYAYNQNRNSDYHMALDKIKQTFEPDWKTEQSDIARLNSQKEEALKIFQDQFENDQLELGQYISEDVKNVIQEAKIFYNNQVKKDFDFFCNHMIKDSEKIYDLYLKSLLLILELANLVQVEVREKEKKQSRMNVPVVKYQPDLNFYNNKVILKLKEEEQFHQFLKDKKVSWSNQKNTIWNWYKDILKKTEAYEKYIQLTDPTFEDDKQFILFIVKQIIFKNEVINAFMEEVDLYWAEDKAVVRSMVSKTIKSIEPETPMELAILSTDWEEDRDYFKLLFEYTVKNQKEYERILMKKIKNWELDRIAWLDHILLKMAMSEMINFPSIPIKVTINEYIEISKNYSTPKSKQFINGVLDVVANELIAEGVIRKSGRGLIDNK
ncbi:MAG: transcription antitermination factor NusB [Candidatus Cyclobacteriaceae bacterium M3_2C_046]